MTAYTRMVEQAGDLSGLEAYSASRPPHSEGLAVTIASYLAHETGLPTINLLHLSSAKAMEAAMLMARHVPARGLPQGGDDRAPARRRHHGRRDRRQGEPAAAPARRRRGAVGAPARRERRLGGQSDHACCKDETKFGEDRSTTCSRPSPASAAPSTCCPGWWGRAASAVFSLSADRGADGRDPGAPLRPAHQGRHRRRLRRRHRAGRPGHVLDVVHAGGLGVDAAVHPVRRAWRSAPRSPRRSCAASWSTRTESHRHSGRPLPEQIHKA